MKQSTSSAGMTSAATNRFLLISLSWSSVIVHEALGRVTRRTTGIGESEVVATVSKVLEVVTTLVLVSMVIMEVGS